MLFRSIFVALVVMVLSPDRSMATPRSVVPDSLMAEAAHLVESTLNLLRNSRDLGPFKDRFSSNAAKHPCDICIGTAWMEPMPLEVYAFSVSEHFPDTCYFHFQVDARHIGIEYDGNGRPVRVNVPYTKWIRATHVNRTKDEIERKLFLLAKVLVDADGHLSMETIVEELPPAEPITALELALGTMLGRLTFDNEELEPDHRGTVYSLSLLHYFHPFRTLNRRNIWLKAGVRLSMLDSRLMEQGVSFESRDVVLTPVYTTNDQLDQRIDVAFKVSDVDQRVRKVTLEVPLGASKRWRFRERVSFLLDLGGSVGYELEKKLTGGCRIDQHGANHRIMDVVMRDSHGEALVYTSPDAAVLTGEGVLIDFYSDRSEVWDRVLEKRMFYSVGITPSLLYESKSGGAYRVGFDLSFMKDPNVDIGELDAMYFGSHDGDVRPALSDMAQNSFRPRFSILLALQL